MQVTHELTLKKSICFHIVSKLIILLGVAPSYDYIKGKLSHKTQFKCYAMFVMYLVTSYSVVSLYYRCKNVPMTMSVRILDILVELMGIILWLVTISGNSFWNMRQWDKLISSLYRLERVWNRGIRHVSLKENSLALIIGGSMFYMFAFICNFFCMPTTEYLFHITQKFYNYFKFVLLVIIYNVTLSLKDKYKKLNKTLRGAISANITRRDAIKIIQRVRALNLEMDSIVETFNVFFGWPLLFILAHSFAQILGCLSSLVFLRGWLYFDFVMCLYLTTDLVSIISNFSYIFENI